MVSAISTEIDLRKGYIPNNIDTLYFGGGTPSLLASDKIEYLINKIRTVFTLHPAAEITLEANPEDITAAKAGEYRAMGINRISLGVQSFDDQILRQLNRQHEGKQAIDAIHLLKGVGLDNLTIDLIYGIPGQSTKTWQANLAQAIALDIPHLSSYALTLEDKTAYGHWQKSGKIKAVSDETYNKEYNLMCETLKNAGYAHYEVSNFARPGFKSRHNSSYWQRTPYLGLGPGAHSYNITNRQFNLSVNAGYIKAMKNKTPAFKEEVLSRVQLYNEYLLTGLRTDQGIDLAFIKTHFNIDVYRKHEGFITRCINDKMAILSENRFILTDSALILADSVIIEMMIDEDEC